MMKKLLYERYIVKIVKKINIGHSGMKLENRVKEI